MEAGPEDNEEEAAAEDLSPFGRQLARLKANKFMEDVDDSFSFRATGTRWTMEQALAVSDALMASSGLGSLCMELAVCRPEAIGLFLNYIGSSKSLQRLCISYDPHYLARNNSNERFHSFECHIDNVFLAVLKNPSITSLETELFGSHESIVELLSLTSSLRSLELDLCNIGDDEQSREMAWQTAVAFSRNTSLTKVNLGSVNECYILGQLISGLDRHPSLQELSIWYKNQEPDTFAAISKLLHFTPSLKKLKIREDSFESPNCDANVDMVLLDLYQPSLGQRLPLGAAGGLQELHLSSVSIGVGWEKIQKQNPSVLMNSKVNNVLKTLILDNVNFIGRNAVKLLWRFVGLRTLAIKNVRYEVSPKDGRAETEDGEDEDDDSVWEELLERNPKLETVSTNEVNHACLRGVLQGASSHEKLKSLTITQCPFIPVTEGILLRRMLQKTKSIKHFGMHKVIFATVSADQLACGISSNVSIESLVLDTMETQSGSFQAKIVGSLIVNNKLKCLDLRCLGLPLSYNGKFCRTLLAMLRVNTTLLRLHLPCVDFRGTALGNSLQALIDSKSRLKTLDLIACLADAPGLEALGRYLEREDIALDEVYPPIIYGETYASLATFISSLTRVTRRLVVGFQKTQVLTIELLELLLQAANENKNLIYFGNLGASDLDSDICKKIEFQVKLNRFGRALFGSPTIMPRNLWPAVLAPMAVDEEDSDALFYSLREFFASGPTSPQVQAPQSARPSKRARIGT